MERHAGVVAVAGECGGAGQCCWSVLQGAGRGWVGWCGALGVDASPDPAIRAKPDTAGHRMTVRRRTSPEHPGVTAPPTNEAQYGRGARSWSLVRRSPGSAGSLPQ